MNSNEETKYSLEDLIPLPEAVRMLVRKGVNTTDANFRYEIDQGRIKAQKLGDRWFVLPSEIERLSEGATS